MRGGVLAAALLGVALGFTFPGSAGATCDNPVSIAEAQACTISLPPDPPSPTRKKRLSLRTAESRTWIHARNRVCESKVTSSSGFCYGVTKLACTRVSQKRARCPVQIAYRPAGADVGTRTTCSWTDRWLLARGKVRLTSPEPNCPG